MLEKTFFTLVMTFTDGNQVTLNDIHEAFPLATTKHITKAGFNPLVEVRFGPWPIPEEKIDPKHLHGQEIFFKYTLKNENHVYRKCHREGIDTSGDLNCYPDLMPFETWPKSQEE